MTRPRLTYRYYLLRDIHNGKVNRLKESRRPSRDMIAYDQYGEHTRFVDRKEMQALVNEGLAVVNAGLVRLTEKGAA